MTDETKLTFFGPIDQQLRLAPKKNGRPMVSDEKNTVFRVKYGGGSVLLLGALLHHVTSNII